MDNLQIKVNQSFTSRACESIWTSKGDQNQRIYNPKIVIEWDKCINVTKFYCFLLDYLAP